MTRILVLSGSSRAGSFNAKLASLAATRLEALGAKAKLISLADYPLPMVDASGKGNVPDAAMQLLAEFEAHPGMFITCPEYNAGYTPLLKNALDWVSVAKAVVPGTTFKGKVAALGGASPGAMGGYRALMQLRAVLELGFGALVVPEMVSVGFADKAFSADGGLADERAAGFLTATLERLVRETRNTAL